jgi:HEAT repeat protein
MVLQGVLLGLMLAQTPPPRPDPSAGVKDTDAAALAIGWNAVGSGLNDVAVRAADTILQRRPWDRGATVLRMYALAKASPERGLDAYEQWLKRGRAEDAGLLEPVAIAVLQQIAVSKPELRTQALRALVLARVAGAREALAAEKNNPQAQLAAEVSAARAGDSAASQRLMGMASEGGSPSLAHAFAEMGVSAGEPGLLLLMQSRDPQTRAAAVEALGAIKSDAARAAVTALRSDPDPVVRLSSIISLAQMGDAAAMTEVERMINGTVPDLVIAGARAWEGRPGPWVGAMRPLLDNPDGLIRLEAARAIAPVDPDAARRVLGTALGDANPVIRYESAKAFAEVPDLRLGGEDIAALRQRLRDADPQVRVSVASALLRLARE